MCSHLQNVRECIKLLHMQLRNRRKRSCGRVGHIVRPGRKDETTGEKLQENQKGISRNKNNLATDWVGNVLLHGSVVFCDNEMSVACAGAKGVSLMVSLSYFCVAGSANEKKEGQAGME